MIASWLVSLPLAGAVLAGTAFAQPGGAGAAQGSAASPTEPAASAPPTTPPPPPAAGDLRKACSAAMNADPAFAAEIVKIADERAQLKRDADTVSAHVDANQHVQRNERHVIYAYAAMWIVAAAFVIFLWRRQQVLQGEIAQLRRDLDASASDPAGKGRT
jgi:hypothetical protein